MNSLQDFHSSQAFTLPRKHLLYYRPTVDIVVFLFSISASIYSLATITFVTQSMCEEKWLNESFCIKDIKQPNYTKEYLEITASVSIIFFYYTCVRQICSLFATALLGIQ